MARSIATATVHVAAVLVLALAVAACGGAHGSEPAVSQAVVRAAAPAEPVLEVPREERLGRDVRVEVLADGGGATLRHGGRARVHYTARVAGSDASFASTRAGVPLEVELGRTPLVAGLARALEGRRAGAKLVVHVPAAMGFKDSATAPVPAGSDLAFDVEVVSVR